MSYVSKEQMFEVVVRASVLAANRIREYLIKEKMTVASEWQTELSVLNKCDTLYGRLMAEDYQSETSYQIYQSIKQYTAMSLLGEITLDPEAQPVYMPVVVIDVNINPLLNATVKWAYFSADPTSGIASASFPFSKNYELDTNSLTLDFTQTANQKFLAVKLPVGQTAFNKWYNTALNQGTIPDQVYQDILIIGDFQYLITRDVANIDPLNSNITYSHV